MAANWKSFTTEYSGLRFNCIEHMINVMQYKICCGDLLRETDLPDDFPCQIIGVDLSHIENKVSEIVKHDKNLIVIQGELIDK